VCQPRWTFEINGRLLKSGTRRAQYTADFSYVLASTGAVVVEDVKGMMTPDAQLRIGLMAAVHGIEIQLIRKTRKTRR
jgi:hypothetical protein